MFQSPVTRQPRKRHPAAAAHRPAAAHVAPGGGLFLPVIPRTIPARWEETTGNATALKVAELLVDVGVLHERHLARGRSTKDVIEAALAEVGTTVRPRPLSESLSVSLVANPEELEIQFDDYCRQLKLPPQKVPPPSALIIGFNYSHGMHCIALGPQLTAIEAAWPRLGQTILSVLEHGLMHGVRCLAPGSGLDWASNQYWMGEEDEVEYMRDAIHGEQTADFKDWKDLNNWPAERVRKEYAGMGYECFTRAMYDKDFAPHWHRQRKPLKQLPATLPPPLTPPSQPLVVNFMLEDFRHRWPALRDLLQQIRRQCTTDTHGSGHHCSTATWNNVPFMLRFHDDDCLPQIADDVWQMEYETGESDMSANSIFLWHDAPSLTRALARLKNTLAVTQSCEDLLRLLFPEPLETARIKV